MLATLVTLLVVTGVSAYLNIAPLISMEASPDPYLGAPVSVEYDPDKPTAIVLMSRQGTEVTDLMVPYQLLKMSDLFNVYTVAAEKKPIGVNGGIDLLPELSIQDLGLLLKDAPDVVVVPAVHDPGNQELITWIRHWYSADAHILSICEGARLVAASGILDGKKATSHFFALEDLGDQFSKVDWKSGIRYITDERITSSAGVTAAYDATMALIREFGNSELVNSIAADISYDSRVANNVEFDGADFLKALGNIVSPWGRTNQAIWVTDGIDESVLSAALDSYPRTLEIDQVTVADSRRIIRTKHGLQLIPRLSLNDLPEVDRILALSPEDAEKFKLQSFDRDSKVYTLTAQGKFGFSRVLNDIGHRYGELSKQLVAKQLEYPL